MTSPSLESPSSSSASVASQRRPGPWHRRVAGLHVLKVTGDAYTMGRQHGELLREDVPVGPLPYYRTYLERLFQSVNLGPANRLVWPVIRRFVGRRVARSLPPFGHDAIRGLADGAGLPLQEVLDGATMPDALVWTASQAMKLRRAAPALPYRLNLGLGCTSAIAWGDATSDGKLLHARNFDYHGVASWPRTAAVVFHEPDVGFRYVSVAAAGVPLGGVTAMNEAGLTLTVHQHMFTDGAALGGTPIGLVGDQIMREADSLDAAERILRSYRPIGCWTYLITDGRRREVLCFEENPDRQVAHRYGADPQGAGQDTFGYANVYLDPELGATERDTYGSYWRANTGRHRRANALLAEKRGGLDPAGMASILADTGEGACRLHEALAMLMTVGSVVFRPEDGVVWVGTGEAPTSHGTFVAFDLHREDHAPEHGDLQATPAKDGPAAREAFELYRQAYLAYMDDQDLPRARALMERAADTAPDQPLYHSLVGLLALAAEDAQAAFDAFGRALALGHDAPERVGSFRLWRGRAADLLGRRDAARADYQACLEGAADAPVHAAAKQNLRRAYSRRRARRVHVDFAMADVVTP